MTGTENAAQIALQQRDAASLHRHIRAGTHCNANVSLGQSWRVVDSVAGHCDHGALLLTLLHDLCLPLRQHVSIKLDAELVRYCLGGGLVISRDHNDFQTGGCELANCIGRGFLDRIGDPNQARRLAIQGYQHYGLALFAQFFSAFEQRCRIDRKIAEQFRISNSNLLARDGSLYALASGGAESDHIDQGKLLCFRALHDGCCQRVFTGALKAGDELEQAGFLDTWLRNDGTKRRLTFGEGSGLVDDECVNLAKYFQRLSIANENACASPATGAHHDRHGRGETECARAIDDKNCDGVYKGMSKAGLRTGEEPDSKCDDGCNNYSGYKVRRHSIRQPLNRRPRPLRFADHLHNLRQQRVCANPLRADHESAGSVDGSRRDFRVFILFNRDGLSADHGFIDGAVAIKHGAIHRHLFAGTHTKPITNNTRSSGTSASPPLSSRRLAVFGARPSKARIALLVWLRARSSITCPRRTSATITAAGSKYTSICPPAPRNDSGNTWGTTVAKTL